MKKILLAGEGGQGVQTVAKILTIAAQKAGKQTSYIPSFGVEQRGGVSLSYIQLDSEPIPYPRFEKADIIVAFCDRALPVIEKFITSETLLIFDNSAIHDDALEPIKEKIKNYLSLPVQSLAQERFSTKVLNIIFLGALFNQFKDISFNDLESALIETLGAKFKDESMKQMNLSALREGINFAQNFDPEETKFVGIKRKEIKQEFSDDKKTWTRFPDYCKGCCLCITRCPVKALQFSDEVGFLGNPLPIVDINKCIGCGMCEKTCPDGAIKVDRKSSNS